MLGYRETLLQKEKRLFSSVNPQLEQKRGGDEERIFWFWSHKRGSEIRKQKKKDMEKKGVREDEKEEVRGTSDEGRSPNTRYN